MKQIFKTIPFKHQRKALRLSKDKKVFALLMEQGTGKSKVIIDTFAHLWREHKIDLGLIIGPKGVVPGWVRRQLPEHMSDDIPYAAGQWKAGMSKTREIDLNRILLKKDILRIIVMNVEAIGMTDKAIDFAIDALESSESAMVVIDESHRIKTPSASVTKRILKHIRPRCTYRRILTGTIGDKPFDLFSQFGFLDPDILGTANFTAFKGEYAELLPDNSGLMRHIAQRLPKKWAGDYIDEETGQITPHARSRDGIRNKQRMVPAYMPTIVATNKDGTPKYRNLDKLEALIAPHRFRVLKRDCLDLPQKLYGRYYTELDERQWKLYRQVRDELRVEWEDGGLVTFSKLTAILRLQQIVCGYVGSSSGGTIVDLFPSWKENPRILSMLEYIEDRPDGEGTIIWCRFVSDIRRVSEALRESYGARSVVQFYGDVKDSARNENVARFQGSREIMDRKGNFIRKEEIAEKDRARFMVAQPASGGVGQTWTAANLSFHYSNTFSLIDRLQCEDRPHRIGQYHPVQYTDLEAEETVDSIIIASLIGKKNVADTLNADKHMEWLK